MLKHKYFFSIISIQEIARTMSYSFLVLYILKNGFSLNNFSFIKTLSLATIFICEIPSGWLSDKIGRKKVWASAVLLFLCSSLFYLFLVDNHNFIYPAEIFYGIGFAALTGTLRSSKINEIKEKEPQYLQSFYFDQKIVLLSARTLGSLVGAVCFYYTNINPFIISASIFGFLLIYSYWYKDFQVEIGRIPRKQSIRDKMKFIKESKIIYLFISLMLMQLIIIPAFHYWQPVFKASTKHYKILLVYSFVLFNLSGIIGSIVGKRILKSKNSIFIGMFLMCLPLFFMVFVGNGITAIVMLIASSFGRNIYDPKFKSLIQSKISDKNRGTITSIMSSIGSACGIIVFTLSGLLLKNGATILLLLTIYPTIYFVLNIPLIIIATKKNNCQK